MAEIIGTEGPDNLVGTRGDDLIEGLGGDDTISGEGGIGETLRGGEGDDDIRSTLTWIPVGTQGRAVAANHLLEGGAGNDRLYGSGRLNGGEGADVITGYGTLNGGGGDDQIQTIVDPGDFSPGGAFVSGGS